MPYTFAGRYCETALKTDGTLAKAVTVQVNISGGAAATLYTDRTKGTGASNPIVTDSTTAQASFYVDPGLYDLVGTGVSVIAVEVGADPAEYLQTTARNAVSGVVGLDASKRIVAQASAITAVAGANAGASPPVPIVTGATDQRGNITFGTGTAPAAGAMVVVTFSGVWAVAPVVGIDPANSAAALLNPYVSAVTTAGFAISFATIPAASQANTVYAISYVAIG